MKKRAFVLLFFFLCLQGVAQTKDEDTGAGVECVALRDGTSISVRYSQDTNILIVDIQNNPEDIEIVVVKDGVTMYSERSSTEDDNVNLDLSKYKNCAVEIYVRNKRECQYVCNVVYEQEN